jgi:WD40 repeat protein
MDEPAVLNGVASSEPAGASADRQVTIRQDVVGSTIIAGDRNVVTQTVTIIHQYSRAEPEPEEPARFPTAFPASPYKGLEAFYEEDADWFFGRRAVVDTLWHRLRDLQTPPLPAQPPRTRLLAIIGPSGSGKSSVARAGLVPELARRPIPGLANPRVAIVVPHTEPVEALATVLARIATNDPAPAARTREFAEELRRAGQSGAPDGLRRIANVLSGADRHPLIVLVDQFEEIFTGAAEAERLPFIETLLNAARDVSGRISVVLTLRSDFLSATGRYPALDAAIAAGSELVPAMTEAELREAISFPAERAAKSVGIPNPLDPGTIELLAQETIGREGALPLLQFALNRIWDGLAKDIPAAETLRNLGGVGGALAAEADRLLDDAAKSGKEDLVRRAFLAMVQLGEGSEDTRRRARLSEIVAVGETPDDVMAILRRFARPGDRLVTFASDRGETTLEVTHEQLIARWPTLRTWLRDWREDERFRHRLTAAANAYPREGGLWGPTELELARRWLARPGQITTAKQQGFIDASETALRKQRWQAKRITILTRIATLVLFVLFLATAALAVGLVGAAIDAAERSKAANAAAREAIQQTVRGQAFVARLENERGHRFEAALAALSGIVLPFRNDEQLSQTELYSELVRAYSADRVLVPPLRHGDSVVAASFDPKGELVLTASADNTARIWDARTGEPIGQPLRHAGPVRAASFDPKGERVITGSDDGTARFWTVRTSEPIGEALRHTAGVQVVAFDSKGERVVTASTDTAQVWDARTGAPIGRPLQHKGGIRTAKFDPTGERVVTASDDRTAHIWNARTGEPIGKSLPHLPSTKDMFFTNVTDAAFDPKGERVVTASVDHTARIWDARTGAPIGKPLQHTDWVRTAAFDPAGAHIVTASEDGTARVWDGRTDEPIGKPLQHEGPVLSAAFDREGKRIVTTSTDGTARIWDAHTGEPIGEPMRHTGWVYAAAFDPASERVVTASADGTARIWDIRASEPLGQPIEQKGLGVIAGFDVPGKRAATLGTTVIWDSHTGEQIGELCDFDFRRRRFVTLKDNAAQLWDARTGEPIGATLRHSDCISAAAFDPKGERVITASAGHTAQIWDLRTDSPLCEPPLEYAGEVLTAAFDPTGEYVITTYAVVAARDDRPGESDVTSSARAIARLWNAHTCKPIGQPLQSAGWGLPTFDASGGVIISYSGRGVDRHYELPARVWDTHTAEPIGKALPNSGSVYDTDPTGDRIIVVHDYVAQIWDIRTGAPIGSQLHHDGGIKAAAFDPKGERVVTASVDHTARIWDARTGQPVGKRLQHAGLVLGAAFDPNGERVVTASFDGTARIWDARTGEPIGKPLQHDAPVWTAVFDPQGEQVLTKTMVTDRQDPITRTWRILPSGQTLVDEVRAVLGLHSPQPLKLPEIANQHEDFGTLAALGMHTLFERARRLLQSN